MIVKNYVDVKEEAFEVKGGKGIMIRWLVNDETGINFAMRRYELANIIPRHKHPYEHEICFLKGKGIITDGAGNRRDIGPGDFAYVPPNEVH